MNPQKRRQRRNERKRELHSEKRRLKRDYHLHDLDWDWAVYWLDGIYHKFEYYGPDLTKIETGSPRLTDDDFYDMLEEARKDIAAYRRSVQRRQRERAAREAKKETSALGRQRAELTVAPPLPMHLPTTPPVKKGRR